MASVAEQSINMNGNIVAGQLPMRKRKKPEDEGNSTTSPSTVETKEPATKLIKKTPSNSKQKEIRLEQNRKAARESRRRKKVMIEELQRSVIFFSRANGTLKQQNDDLARLLMQAQAQVAAIESQKTPAPAPQTAQPAAAPAPAAVKTESTQQAQPNNFQQQQAQTVATQAVYEAQGFSPAAARAAAQTMNAGPANNQQVQNGEAPSPPSQQLPPMQPGATMQAMANFQQAAAAAMQAAMQGMQGIPGVSVSSLAAVPTGSNPQQAYNDTMTALAMQQAAAAAAAGQQFFHQNPFMAHQMMAWQHAAQAGVSAPVAPQSTQQPNAQQVQPASTQASS